MTAKMSFHVDFLSYQKLENIEKYQFVMCWVMTHQKMSTCHNLTSTFSRHFLDNVRLTMVNVWQHVAQYQSNQTQWACYQLYTTIYPLSPCISFSPESPGVGDTAPPKGKFLHSTVISTWYSTTTSSPNGKSHYTSRHNIDNPIQPYKFICINTMVIAIYKLKHSMMSTSNWHLSSWCWENVKNLYTILTCQVVTEINWHKLTCIEFGNFWIPGTFSYFDLLSDLYSIDFQPLSSVYICICCYKSRCKK